MYPVVYGRAKALLGLVPTAPYGSKSRARRKAKEAKALQEALRKTTDLEDNGRTRARRSRRTSERNDPLSSLETLVSDLKATVAERDRYRVVLEKVTKLLRAELGDD